VTCEGEMECVATKYVSCDERGSGRKTKGGPTKKGLVKLEQQKTDEKEGNVEGKVAPKNE